jgi:hypothetical protein
MPAFRPVEKAFDAMTRSVDRQPGPRAYCPPASRLLAAWYVGPDFPMKLRLLGILQRLIGLRRIIRRTDLGFLMALDAREFIQSRILFQGLWEKELTILLSQELRPTDVFYDIGANVGYFTCLAAQCGVAEIVAFEPDPLICAVLCHNLELIRAWLRDRAFAQSQRYDSEHRELYGVPARRMTVRHPTFFVLERP